MSPVMMPIDNFFRSAARWPNRIAVETLEGDNVTAINYETLAKKVNALATALQKIDPKPQSRVGICAYNTLEHLLGFLQHVPRENMGTIESTQW